MSRRTHVYAAVVLLLAGAIVVLYAGPKLVGYLLRRGRAGRGSTRPAAMPVVGEPSAPVGGLSGRWVVHSGRIGRGGRFRVAVRFRNVGRQTLALQEFSLAPVEVEVLDADDRPVPAASELDASRRRKIGWQAIAPDGSLTLWVGPGPDAPAAAANLEIAAKRWVLAPGRYRLRGRYTSRHFTAPEPELKHFGARLWSGRIELPPVEIEVTGAGREGASRPTTRRAAD